MSRKLNQYSSEFKKLAIKLTLYGDKPITQTYDYLRIKKALSIHGLASMQPQE